MLGGEKEGGDGDELVDGGVSFGLGYYLLMAAAAIIGGGGGHESIDVAHGDGNAFPLFYSPTLAPPPYSCSLSS